MISSNAIAHYFPIALDLIGNFVIYFFKPTGICFVGIESIFILYATNNEGLALVTFYYLVKG